MQNYPTLLQSSYLNHFFQSRQKYFHLSYFLNIQNFRQKNFSLSIFFLFPFCRSFKNSLFLLIPRTLSHKLSLYGSVNVTLKVLIFLLHCSLLKLKESRNNEAKKYFFVGSQDHSVCFLFSVRSYLGHLDSSFNIFFRLAINNKLEQLQKFFILLLFGSLLPIVI